MAVTYSPFDLTGRVALVTGGGRGLGREMALALARSGAKVIVTARSTAQLATVVSQIEALGGQGSYVSADLHKPDAVNAILAHSTSAYGSIDILVNNAGVYMEASIDGISDDDWTNTLEANVTSAFRLLRGVAPMMKKRKWGRIINVASILGLASRSMAGAYSASKAALIGLTRASAFDLGPYGITVNCLVPGAFNAVDPDAPPTDRQTANFRQSTALGRWGKPSELSGPLLLLASDAGSYITGSTLVVDGGALAKTLYQ